jgi:type I restriction enzyme S subunit
MAQRLFRSWFVDFDPVHAKSALRRQHPRLTNAEISRRALPSMAPEIAELFPESFEDSTLGAIPKGWMPGFVPDAIEINPSRSIVKGTTVAWLEMAKMPIRSARALSWELREFKSGTKFINGDTLVARITPCLENGKTAFVDFLGDGEVGAGSTEYIVLRPKPPLPPIFAYLLARTDDFRQHLITNMTGTSGRQRAPADCLNTFPLVTPPKEIAECFAEVTGNFFSQMKAIDEESFGLTITRDRLLPRLLSGEIEIAGNGETDEST